LLAGFVFFFHFSFGKPDETCKLTIAVGAATPAAPNIAKRDRSALIRMEFTKTLQYWKVDLLRISFSLGTADGRFMGR